MTAQASTAEPSDHQKKGEDMRSKTITRRAAILLSLTLGSFALTGPARTEDQKITIGILTTGAPFTMKENGKYKGFEVDLIEWIAKSEHLEIVWNDLKFEAMIPALQAHQIDAAAASFFVTDARRKVVDFSTSYYAEGNVLAVPVNSEIKSLEDLKGKTIVAKKGAAGLISAQKIAEKHDATVRALDDEPAMYLDVQTANSAGVVHDSAILGYKISQDGANPTLRLIEPVIDTSDVALAFPKDSPLLAVFNDGLKKAQETGELARINKKYFGG